MADYVTLLGAEQVERAGYKMAEAADQMMRAAGYMDEAMQRHQRFMDDWLIRFEQAIEKMNPPKPPKPEQPKTMFGPICTCAQWGPSMCAVHAA